MPIYNASSYCQDDYLKKIGVHKEAVQAFCDTVLKKSIPLGNYPDTGINKNIQFGKGEFYYVNNQSLSLTFLLHKTKQYGLLYPPTCQPRQC